MTEVKWKVFLEHYWTILSYWEMLQCFRAKELGGSFFALSGLACRNMFLFSIAKFAELCEKTEENLDFGPDATKTLTDLMVLYNKGDIKKRDHLDFDSCGIGPFRDKILGHPLNSIKVVLEKQPFKVSLDWALVEETLRLIKLFVQQAENYFQVKSNDEWTLNGFTESVLDVNHACADVQIALDLAAKYEVLHREAILAPGDLKVRMNYETHEIEVVK